MLSRALMHIQFTWYARSLFCVCAGEKLSSVDTHQSPNTCAMISPCSSFIACSGLKPMCEFHLWWLIGTYPVKFLCVYYLCTLLLGNCTICYWTAIRYVAMQGSRLMWRFGKWSFPNLVIFNRWLNLVNVSVQLLLETRKRNCSNQSTYPCSWPAVQRSPEPWIWRVTLLQLFPSASPRMPSGRQSLGFKPVI